MTARRHKHLDLATCWACGGGTTSIREARSHQCDACSSQEPAYVKAVRQVLQRNAELDRSPKRKPADESSDRAKKTGSSDSAERL